MYEQLGDDYKNTRDYKILVTIINIPATMNEKPTGLGASVLQGVALSCK